MSGLIDRISEKVPLLRDKARMNAAPDKGQVAPPEKRPSVSERLPSRDIEFYRMLLVGLSVDCPLDKKPDDCLLKNERLLSFEKKMDWAQSLSDKNIMELYWLHHECLHAIKGARAN